jgi:hypothetical protein
LRSKKKKKKKKKLAAEIFWVAFELLWNTNPFLQGNWSFEFFCDYPSSIQFANHVTVPASNFHLGRMGSNRLSSFSVARICARLSSKTQLSLKWSQTPMSFCRVSQKSLDKHEKKFRFDFSWFSGNIL